MFSASHTHVLYPIAVHARKHTYVKINKYALCVLSNSLNAVGTEKKVSLRGQDNKIRATNDKY